MPKQKQYDYAQTVEGRRRFDNPEIYQATLDFQEKMKTMGVAWHNPFADECTVDFCCCEGDNLPDTNYHTFLPSSRTVAKQAMEELAGSVDPHYERVLLENAKKLLDSY